MHQITEKKNLENRQNKEYRYFYSFFALSHFSCFLQNVPLQKLLFSSFREIGLYGFIFKLQKCEYLSKDINYFKLPHVLIQLWDKATVCVCVCINK